MSSDRLFLAVAIGREQREQIERNMEILQRALTFQKWVQPDDLHVTLKFLGDTPLDTAEQVKAATRKLAAGHTPFSLSLQGLGTFGRSASPSILWLGVSGDLTALGELQSQVEHSVEPFGFTREDGTYSPHVTLARRFQGASALLPSALRAAEQAIEPLPAPWTVDRIVLYRSHLHKKPMYEAIDHFDLGSGNR
ncbi:RNA 2',3'-cyclic phosphodiesterase [Paenibacillus xerothermodurans]|nr:RNA 2',3'-cyclic phosphodiesterase [Paenibacillus xerothermodurans]